jgi:non-specific protein-tyrosine kinase
VLLNTGAGFLTGLFLGVLLAMLFEQLDIHVHTSEELSQLLGWSVLATIWRSSTTTNSEMINPQGRDANIESYRILRTNIGFSGVDKPLHSLMVTSSSPGDGKSTIAANLAIFMAKAGKSTLLIDADLRRPTQHQLFDITVEKQGLSNAILAFGIPIATNASSIPQFIPPTSLHQSGTSNGTHFSLEPYAHSVGIPNLRVIPSGPLPPNPSDLLDSKAMQRLLAALATCGAEIVIFDAPPIRGLSDAGIMASKVDGTLVVVDIARSNKNYLVQTKTLLSQAGAHVVGCVANKQRRSRHDTSSYYYYQYGKQDGRGDATPQANGHIQAGSHADSTQLLDAAKSAVKVALSSGKEGGRTKNAR